MRTMIRRNHSWCLHQLPPFTKDTIANRCLTILDSCRTIWNSLPLLAQNETSNFKNNLLVSRKWLWSLPRKPHWSPTYSPRKRTLIGSEGCKALKSSLTQPSLRKKCHIQTKVMQRTCVEVWKKGPRWDNVLRARAAMTHWRLWETAVQRCYSHPQEHRGGPASMLSIWCQTKRHPRVCPWLRSRHKMSSKTPRKSSKNPLKSTHLSGS